MGGKAKKDSGTAPFPVRGGDWEGKSFLPIREQLKWVREEGG